MAAFGQALMVGLIGGAITNAALDSTRLKDDCETANKFGIEINKTLQWMNTNIQETSTNLQSTINLRKELEYNHLKQLTILQDFLNNQKDNRNRTQQLLSVSVCVILILFIIKILF